MFGHGSSASYLIARTNHFIVSWNLLTCSVWWSLECKITSLVSDPYSSYIVAFVDFQATKDKAQVVTHRKYKGYFALFYFFVFLRIFFPHGEEHCLQLRVSSNVNPLIAVPLFLQMFHQVHAVSGSTRPGCGRYNRAAWQRFGKVQDFAYE